MQDADPGDSSSVYVSAVEGLGSSDAGSNDAAAAVGSALRKRFRRKRLVKHGPGSGPGSGDDSSGDDVCDEHESLWVYIFYFLF